MDTAQLDSEINDVLIEACKPFCDKIHAEIQRLLNKIHKVYPIKRIFMGNGTFFIHSYPIKYWEDGEECSFVLDDLTADACDGYERSFYWNHFDPRVKSDFCDLCWWLDYLLISPHWKYLTLKDFKPN